MFFFLVPAHVGCPEQRAIKQVIVLQTVVFHVWFVVCMA